MNLTEFLKYYIITKPENFGEFVRSRRSEFGLSVRQFAKNLGISAVYLSDIENGNRPAPINLLPIFIQELQISQDEQEPFMDLVNVSRQEYPEIKNYITTHPNARKFMQIAAEGNIPDEYFKQLIIQIEEQSNITKDNDIEKELQ